ncbi:hypothetical protein BZA70DRAFT_271463 [Myxozyma melibiosi]|uniref:UV excision repair protein RAD23 n=1 Tax=Myxozyma melibiosi TaxID=54550 RepID=A0ABR1FCD5_9ASCO
MQLTLRDIKRQKWTVDVEPTDTIASVKKTIQEQKGWDADLQMLIYSGKTLVDDRTVESYNVKETDFIVCMVSKRKPAPAAAAASTSTPAPATPGPAPVSTPAAPAPAQAPSTPAAPAAAAPAAAPAATPADAATPSPAFNDPSAFSIGNAREAAIGNMMEMGYEREAIERAMRAAFNNPDRAVDYLLNGIPEHLIRDAPQPGAAGAAATESAGAAEPTSPTPASATSQPSTGLNLFEAAAQASQQRANPEPASAGASSLDFLRNSSQFQQLRDLIRQQPQLLDPILHQVAQSNPQLASLIQSNPDGFVRLLTEGADEEGAERSGYQIEVTAEESAAIDRLCNLGFDRQVVIQAYFACDKNEEVAANYLFEHGHEDEE